MTKDHATEPKFCLAAEWSRDGRGLWATRTCSGPLYHGREHVFGPWQYNVEPPVAALAQGGAHEPPLAELRLRAEQILHRYDVHPVLEAEILALFIPLSVPPTGETP